MKIMVGLMRIAPFLILISICSSLIIGCGGSSNNFSGEKIRYAALGASDISGVATTSISNTYVFQIEDGLEDRGRETELFPLGIPGAEIDLIRDLAVEAAELTNPDLVTIFAGANDIIGGRDVSSFEENLNAVLSELSSDTDAFIVIATIPNLSALPAFQDDPDSDVTTARIDQFNEVILRLAGIYGVSVVDLRGFDVTADVTASDGFHPNERGHMLLAEMFMQVIEAHFF